MDAAWRLKPMDHGENENSCTLGFAWCNPTCDKLNKEHHSK